jgi:hypothetical protein
MSETCECIEDEQSGKYCPEAQADNPRCSPLVHGCEITAFPVGAM